MLLFGLTDPGNLATLQPSLDIFRNLTMAKPVTQKIKLLSSAGTGYYYVTKKNPRNLTEKLALKKYDPVVKKHVEFKEAKIK
jgi:large subunit ribosomal protein L33